MKQCKHCGRGNKDDATCCIECGSAGFVLAARPRSSDAADVFGAGPPSSAYMDFLRKAEFFRSRRGTSHDLPAAYIDYLREHSVCKGLRRSITTLFWLYMIPILVLAALLTYHLARMWVVTFVHGGKFDMSQFLAQSGVSLLVLLVMLIVIFLLVTYRQFAMMIVTFVDSSAIHHRDAMITPDQKSTQQAAS